MLKTQLNKIGMYIDVNHVSIHQIPADIDVIVTNENLYEAAKSAAPAGVPVIAMKTSWMLLNRQQLPRRLKTWLNKSDCGAIIKNYGAF